MKVTQNELRIGNWISGWMFPDTPFQLNSCINVDKLHSEELVYSAIPLTEEWLIKFGFEKDSPKIWRVKYCRPLTVFNQGSKFTIRVGTLSLINRSYVHTLQNLHFYITGRELV